MQPLRAVGVVALVAGLVVVAMSRLAGSDETAAGARTVVVTRVVDGDTVEIGSGRHVRLIGVDTPERRTCGHDEATDALRRLVRQGEAVLVDPAGVQDEDSYGRLLRYLEVDGTDAGLDQIRAGLGTARYDSRDGYDPHPREDRYHRVDRRAEAHCG